MKYLKMLGLAAVSATTLMAFAGTASATTLEIGGATRNEAVTITATKEAGVTLRLRDTFFVSINTCTGSHIKATTTTFTGTKVTGPVEELSFTGCNENATVDNKGKLYIEHEAGTTNGNVYWEEAEYTTFSTTLNEYINCKTGAGTLIGTLDGVLNSQAKLTINASLSCFRANGTNITAKLEGSYTVTSPEGLGVSA